MHTPGPWTAVMYPMSGDIHICTGVPGDVGGSIFEGAGVLPDDAENVANAILMTAAPELLEVLKLLVEEGRHDPAYFGNVNLVVRTKHVEVARAAIAKAEGRS